MSVLGGRDVRKEACAVKHLKRNLQQFRCARLADIWTHSLTASLSSTVLTICVADIWRTRAWYCTLQCHSLVQLFIHVRSLSTCKRKHGARHQTEAKMITTLDFRTPPGCHATSIFYFNKFLDNDQSGPFFLGKLPYYCDFGTYHQFSLIRVLDDTIFDDFSSVKLFMNAIENLKAISEYLSSRPELIGVGEEPKLLIGGKAVSTGIKPD